MPFEFKQEEHTEEDFLKARHLFEHIALVFLEHGVGVDSEMAATVLAIGFEATCKMAGEDPREVLDKLLTQIAVNQGEMKVS